MLYELRALPLKRWSPRGQLPFDPASHDHVMASLNRMSGRLPQRGDTRSTILSPDRWSVGRDKAGRPRAVQDSSGYNIKGPEPMC
jgi:hypothetical protein